MFGRPSVIAAVVTIPVLLSLIAATPARAVAQADSIARAAAKAVELAKFDDPQPHMARTGPGGTAWDAQYRCFIQTDENAISKGLPTHAAASAQIKTDAALSNENLQKHKGWILYIKHFSQAYRPDTATADFKWLYSNLVNMEFGDKSSAASAPSSALSFAGDPRVNIRRDVVYGNDDRAAQRMDAYLVKSAAPAPVMVEFHGGGWRRGAKSEFNAYTGDLISKAIDAGISIISVEYRMTPAYSMPAMTDDAARAVQFIRTKAKEWNIDPRRIVAIGGSAGAHLAAWVALHDDLANGNSPDPVARQSSRLSAFVDLWGPMDLTRPNPVVMATLPLRGEDFANAFTAACGCSATDYVYEVRARARLRAASPLFLVTADDPPGIIVHQGPEITDRNHPAIPAMINDPHSWQQGVLLADAMDDAGVEVLRYISPTAGKDPEKDVAMILGFIRKHLGLTAPR